MTGVQTCALPICSFNGHLSNGSTGVATIDADFAPTQGLDNSGQLTMAAGRRLSANGSGLANTAGATLTLNGGTLDGNGAVVNDGTLQLNGTVAGSAAFTNRGTVNQTGGVTLTRSGALDQQGTWSMNGQMLKCCSGSSGFVNSGTLDMGGPTASIVGGGTLNNKPAGTIRSAGGTLDVTLQNDGQLALSGGKLTLSRDINNTGTVALNAADAQLAGATLHNTGTVQGRGRIDSAIDNRGTVRAAYGELVLNGSVSTRGTLAAGTLATLTVTNGLASNDGTLQLEGGSFDNTGHAMVNRGRITGHGTFNASALTNGREISLDGGASSFNGTVAFQTGSLLSVAQGASVDFNGSVNFAAEIGRAHV